MLLAFVLDALRRAIGCAHPDRGEAGLELSLRAGAPGDGLPLGTGRHVLGCDRQDIGNRALTRTPAPGDGEDQLHTDRVYLEVTGDADSPDQVATRQLLAERRALPIAGIGQHTAKASTACDQAINFGKRDLRLRACAPMWDRNAGPLQTCWPPSMTSPSRRRATVTTSPRACERLGYLAAWAFRCSLSNRHPAGGRMGATEAGWRSA